MILYPAIRWAHCVNARDRTRSNWNCRSRLTFLAADSHQPDVTLLEGDPGAGKTTLGLAVPARRRPRGRAGCLRHPFRDRGRAADVAALPWLVARRHHHLRAAPPRRASRPTPSTPSSTLPRSSSRRRRRRCSTRRAGEAERGSSSTRSPRCGCSPATRCATGGRSWPQALLHRPELHGAAARLPDVRPRATSSSRASPTACSRSSSSRPATAASGGACGSASARRPLPRRLPRLPDHDRRLEVFPRLVAPSITATFARSGVERPCRAGHDAGRRPRPRHEHAVMGPAGVGKSTLVGAVYAAAAARRGERAAIFTFDEVRRTMVERAERLGMTWRACRGGHDRRPAVDPGRDDAGRVRRHRARELVEQRPGDRRARQPQRLPPCDAGGAASSTPAARAALLSSASRGCSTHDA